MWIDAIMNSMHKQPHNSDHGSCQFRFNLYDDQGSFGKNKRLNCSFNSLTFSKLRF